MSGFGLPPYAEIVFDPDVQASLGLERVGVLCALVRLARADGTGAWVIEGKVDELADRVGVGVNKMSRELAGLADMGLIGVVAQRSLGKGNGSSARSYTLFPRLFGLQARPVGLPHHGLPHSGAVRDGDLQLGGLYGESPHDEALEPASPGDSTPLHVVVDQSQQHRRTAMDSTPPAPTAHRGAPARSNATVPAATERTRPQSLSPAVTAALNMIGWVGPAPVGEDERLLVAVIEHLRADTNVRSPAGVLHRILTRSTLAAYAEGNKLLPPAATAAPPRVGFTLAELDELFEQFPSWHQTVLLEARRVARERDLPVIPPMLLREVALTVGLPTRPGPAVGTATGTER